MLLPITRTYSTTLRKAPDFLATALALQLQAKNLKNTTLFVIRNVITALNDDGTLKKKLNENQAQTIALANAQVRIINAARAAKLAAKLAANPKYKPSKPLPEFGAELPALRARPFAILNLTLLDHILRARPDAEGVIVYRTLPAVAAQQAIREVIESFTGYFEALKSYRKHPASFTGKPQMPGYLGRFQRSTLSFPAQCLVQKEPMRFPSIVGKSVATDYAKSVTLDEKSMKAFSEFPLNEVLCGLRKRCKLAEEAKLCEVRLVPLKGDSVKLEAVYALPQSLPANSLAAKMMIAVPEDTKPSKVNDVLIGMLQDTPAANLPRMAGLDLGQNNFVALAYSTGHRGMILSNDRIAAKLQHFDARLDALKSALMTPELKALQAKKATDKLSPEEMMAFRRGFRELYADKRMVALQTSRSQWLNDALHKVSRGLIKELSARHIELLVIGLNKGWKQEVNMGRKNNRAFLASAHTRLVDLLKYKCLQAGILVVTAEESYTSKTSFAFNEPLQVKAVRGNNGHQPSNEKCESDLQDIPPAPEDAATEPSVILKGRRGKGSMRHVFTSRGAKQPWDRIHADINGAFNILRKILRHFRHHAGLHAGFWLHWLSPHQGLPGMRLRKS